MTALLKNIYFFAEISMLSRCKLKNLFKLS